jgi:hypothetical protein
LIIPFFLLKGIISMAQGRRIAVSRGNIFFVAISGALGVCIGWILGNHISMADLPLFPIIQEKDSPGKEVISIIGAAQTAIRRPFDMPLEGENQ